MADFFLGRGGEEEDDDYYDYSDDDDDEEEGYEHYEITTVDPGPWLLIGTLAFCLLMYALLPCMVVAMSERKRRRNGRRGEEDEEEEEEGADGADEKQCNGAGTSLCDDETEKADEKKNYLPPAEASSAEQRLAHGRMDTVREEDTGSGDKNSTTSSVGSARSLVGPVLETLGPVLDSTPRYGRRPLAAVQRRNARLSAADDGNAASVSLSSLQSGDDGDGDSVEMVSLGEPVDKKRNREEPERDNCDPSAPPSLLQRSNVNIARSGRRRGGRRRRRRNRPRCCSRAFHWFDSLLSIAEWDYETKRLYKLGLPFFVQSILEGGMEIGRVAIVGRMIGTDALSAYTIVDLLVSFTADVLGGIDESLTMLLSHSLGSGNRKLTGQYVQLSVVLYILFSIPFMVMWYFLIERTLLVLGFSAEVARIGKEFAVPYMFEVHLLDGVVDGIHGLLDVCGLENVSTVLTVIGEVAATVAVFVAARFWNPPLYTVGIIYVISSFIYMIGTIALVHWKGWFRRYYCGMFGSCALTNCTAVKKMLSTASYLSAGYLIMYGEWEILTFFASFLGPAEVAAWGLLGTIWEVLEDVTEAIADAAEVRVGLLLGRAEPRNAKISAYKAILIGFVFALTSTAVLFIIGYDLSAWLTTDSTLQLLVNELIPLFGLGNIVLTMGTMAWTIVGAQGRYRLATAIGGVGSWFVTIPMAAVLSIVFRINLQGQTAAIVIGYMVSGMVTNCVLLRSNWQKLSDEVIEFNRDHEIDLSDDESSQPSSQPEEDCPAG